MICKHQFLPSVEVSKMKGETPEEHRSGFTKGILTICALCGQVRKVFEDGQVIIVEIGNGNPETE